MWCCSHCGATIPQGTICAECGRPIDATLSKIAQKVRSVQLRSGVAERWLSRGAKTGFIGGLILSLPLMASGLIVRLLIKRNSTWFVEELGFMLLSVTLLVISFSFVFAVVFLIYGAVIKPVSVALFCSIEHFEQEYGSTKK